MIVHCEKMKVVLTILWVCHSFITVDIMTEYIGIDHVTSMCRRS